MTTPTVAIIGGSVSAAALIDELTIRLSAEELHLRLAAQDHERVRAIVRHGEHLVARRPGWRIEACRSLADAVTGARAVVLLFRIGGLEARRADELLAQRFGIPGDEGLGPGGAANALRTLPVLDDLAADLARLAPQATVLNLVAPLGLTTRALLDHGLGAIGVCELPMVTQTALVEVLGENVTLAYGGFNHLGWFWPVDERGQTRADAVDRLAPAVTAGLVDGPVLERFVAVPLKYFYWLHDPAAAARLGISRETNRAEVLLDLRDRARIELATQPDRRSPAVLARPTPWFTEALVPILEAVLGGPAWSGTANVRNGRLLPAFDPDLVVEVPAVIAADEVTCHPPSATMPPAALAFSRRVARSEQLLHTAWRERDPSVLQQVFSEGPHQLDVDPARELAAALLAASDATAVRRDHASLSPSARKELVVTTMRFETSSTTVTDYVVGAGAWRDDRLRAVLSDRPVVAVVDDEVARHHGSAVDELLRDLDCIGRLEMRGGERSKSLGQLAALLDSFEACELPKHGVVMAIGGGTVSDVVGLAALLMRRAVPFVILPTTLLAQVDAAVGGKNGINSPTTKNAIGHFHHPLVVASDPGLFRTLDSRQLASGVAECIKVFAVGEPDSLTRHVPTLLHSGWAGGDAWGRVVTDAQQQKLRLLADDPYERSSRRLLNYGHAFAHLLEERSAYRLLHGEAVLFGMLVENEVSYELGIATDQIDDLQQLIVDVVPPGCQTHWLPFEVIGPDLDKVRQMRRAAMNLVCLRVPGEGKIIDDVADDLLAVAWKRAEERVRSTTVRTRALT